MSEIVDYATPVEAAPIDPIPLRRRLAAEAVGTFLLVFFGCGSMAVDAAYGGAIGHVGIGIVWGVTVMVLIYALGDVGGAHFNPAVSFAFWLSGRFPGRDTLAYSGVQILFATLASLFLLAANLHTSDLGQTFPTYPAPPTPNTTYIVSADDVLRAFAFEVTLTFALIFVVFCVAVGSKERGLMAGIAIGGTVGVCALAAGPVCRASMNPARSIGPAVASGDLSYVWLYCVAPILGALLGVAVWTYIYRHPRPGRELHEVTRPS